ncbi:ATP-dependent RNA helicase [Candida orthopsilosis Co 90-125]|uniref:ATP-dependent RNA helicase n=1 Tax=Candida orthopsilosis (strain 90-125) TaxID=1136231 RepID=H8X9R9_CANO9|nr:ATP-dependent RNA helicase [Candida orthopsilosis Co 90-125]CCG24735.1 ATP-dependent RNA helicase [Candida orthopsilosis Co 90-125]
MEHTPVPSDWSPYFKRLFSIFHEINKYATFLASHSRGVIPSVQLFQRLNKTITTTDLATIKYLFPEDEIFFDYVDENQIMVSFVEEVKFGSKGYGQTPVANKFDDKGPQQSKQILIFDFQDVKIHGIGKMVKGRKRMKMDTKPREFDASVRQGFFLNDIKSAIQPLDKNNLTKIIQRRDSRFKQFIVNFLGKQDDLERAQEALTKDALKLVPEKPSLTDMVEVLEDKEIVVANDKVLYTTNEMIESLKNSRTYADQIVSTQKLNDTQPPRFQALSSTTSGGLHPEIREALLAAKGISIDDGLYTHQAEALETLLDESKEAHLIVSTSTASGKSLIYQIPVLNSILWDITNGLKGRHTTALFIFPTKALAQDQIKQFRSFLNRLPSNSRRPIVIDTYDGDTPFTERVRISKEADILFTNPDTIHASILPNSNFESWREFIKGLKYIVVDELHIYKGTFGINVGYVMARLLRIKNRFCPDEKSFRFVSCSATISNPAQHFKTICSIPDKSEVVHVSNDGSARCEKKMLVWNPPVLMNNRGERGPADSSNKLITRVSPIFESARLLLTLLTELQGLKIIVFCPIRVVSEMMMREVRSLLQKPPYSKSGLVQSDIMSYRGGYSKSDRRIIEKKMFDGQLRAIIATNALELGIDLSDLDVVITCGFPMSKSNLHQQFGRAGRRKDAKGSLVIFVPGRSPVDQYYIEHADDLVHNTYEDLCVDSLRDMEHGSLILERHLQCAAYEDAIVLNDDYKWFSKGRSFKAFENILIEHLVQDIGNRFIPNSKYMPKPSKLVSIRAVEDDNVAVVDITNNRNIVIEEVELSRTTFTIYDGGIFLHQGQPYLVKEFNHEQRYAKVERVNVDWTTSQRDYTDVDPEEIELVKPLVPISSTKSVDIPAFFGLIKIEMKVFGFFKVNRKEEILEVVEVNNPPIIAYAKGCWLNVPKAAIDLIKAKQLSAAGGIHAAAHGIMNMLPIFVNYSQANANLGDFELATECKAPTKEFKTTNSERKRPARLVFYDTKGGKNGSGYSYKIFECIDELINSTFYRILKCDCQWGCPLCIVSNACREQMRVMSRPASLIVLASFLGLDLRKLAESIPNGPEPGIPPILHETISADTSSVRFSPNVRILNITTG